MHRNAKGLGRGDDLSPSADRLGGEISTSHSAVAGHSQGPARRTRPTRLEEQDSERPEHPSNLTKVFTGNVRKQTQRTRDRICEFADGTVASFPTPPPGLGWKVEDSSADMHTTWTRRVDWRGRPVMDASQTIAATGVAQ
jgi:hypothetical protein